MTLTLGVVMGEADQADCLEGPSALPNARPGMAGPGYQTGATSRQGRLQ